MDDHDLIRITMLMGSAAAILCGVFIIRNSQRPRRWWVRPIYANRLIQGNYHNLMREMRLYDPDMFFHYTRLTIQQFDDLVLLVGPLITKKSNRAHLSPEHRLAITLRFLATGSTFQTLAFQFRVGKSTVCNVVHETCDALWKVLSKRVFIQPSEDNWYKIATEFEKQWNFPHCLDIGSTGSESDGGAFARSSLGKMLESGKLNLPAPKIIEKGNCLPSYFFVADEAFPLKENIMRPYPGKTLIKEQAIFNYRLSRARRIIENTFGILVSRWRIFQGPIVGKVENVDKYIQAAVCLHNYLIICEEKSTQLALYCPPQYVDREVNGELYLGEWRQHTYNCQLLQPLNRLGSNNAAKKFFENRDNLSDYFMREGAVSWQEAYVTRGKKRKTMN